MQFHWKTQELKDLLDTNLSTAIISVVIQGGDYDTETLVIERGSSVMYLCGWTPDKANTSPSDSLVDYVSLNDSQRYGLFANTKPTVEATQLYTDIDKILEDTYGNKITITTYGWKQLF